MMIRPPSSFRTCFRTAALVLAALAASPAMAQSSVCAALPETGPVSEPGPLEIAQPTPMGDRSLSCPDGFRLELGGRIPRCTRPGLTVVDGNPRAACYAALPFGPLAPLPPRSRPTRTCPNPVTTTILRLEGASIGLADAVVSVVPADGIKLTPLSDAGPDVAPDQNPVVQNCFGFTCRLVKLEIESSAGTQVRLRVTLPGRDPAEEILKLPESCPR